MTRSDEQTVALPVAMARGPRSIRPSRNAIVPLILLLVAALIIFCALFPGVVAPHDPQGQDLINRLKPPAWLSGGSWTHPLGTDSLGQDVFSRVIYGSRISMLVVAVSVPGSALVGSTIGAISGYFRGPFEVLMMRLVDVQLALPAILFAVLLAAQYGPSVTNVILIIVIWRWAGYSRVVRADVLSLRTREYVLAARSCGASNTRILLLHIAPNLVSTIMVLASLDIATVVLFEAGLSFLGIGVPTTTVSWGSMVSDGQTFITVAWWVITFPGIAIVAVALIGNLGGDWLRDRLDPRLKNQR